MDLRRAELKERLLAADPAFFSVLREESLAAREIDELLFLANLRTKARERGLVEPELPRVRLALVGAFTLQPLHLVVEQVLFGHGLAIDKYVGEFDNYASELLADDHLVAWKPDVIALFPSTQRVRFAGPLTAPRDEVQAAAARAADDILALCHGVRQRIPAEILLGNLALPARCDLGAARSRVAASDWSFRKLVNQELGWRAPSFVSICDVEYLAYRDGAVASTDERLWFESKQPGSARFVVSLAHEIASGVLALRRPPKKVLVLDLDNTLWGGTIGDLGVDGIEVGTTSPRGEAFRAFQQYAASLRARGILLAVCSKNDEHIAIEPFDRHPEMVLRRADFASFYANWNPKSDNLRAIAAELNLGLDSLVFADDNPAEIEIVRQFTPEVEAIHLGEDPSTFVAKVTERRLFEPRTITAEDLLRSEQYQREAERRIEMGSAADMDSYLKSLEMVATIRPFRSIDVARISQLINKSNQFNLTTRRRSEAEVTDVMNATDHAGFTIRLADRFGDHGLIAILIGRVADETDFVIDTWVMSCRVLKRQVEEETLNELVRVASARGCTRLVGSYLPTAKNGLVKELYTKLGFATVRTDPSGAADYELPLATYQPTPTHMQIRRTDD